MVIGGYTMDDQGIHGITITEVEAGWSFYMQGDDADNFRSEWELAQEYGSSFGEFLYDHEYNTLFQQGVFKMWFASVSPNIWIADDGTLDTVVKFYDGKDTQTYRYDTEYRNSFPDDDQFLREVYEELNAYIVQNEIRSVHTGNSRPAGNPWD